MAGRGLEVEWDHDDVTRCSNSSFVSIHTIPSWCTRFPSGSGGTSFTRHAQAISDIRHGDWVFAGNKSRDFERFITSVDSSIIVFPCCFRLDVVAVVRAFWIISVVVVIAVTFTVVIVFSNIFIPAIIIRTIFVFSSIVVVIVFRSFRSEFFNVAEVFFRVETIRRDGAFSVAKSFCGERGVVPMQTFDVTDEEFSIPEVVATKDNNTVRRHGIRAFRASPEDVLSYEFAVYVVFSAGESFVVVVRNGPGKSVPFFVWFLKFFPRLLEVKFGFFA